MTVSHIFDIGAACLFAFFIVKGALRGLTGEILSLVGLLASVACGWTFAQPAANFVLRYFPTWDHIITELLCAIAIFIGVSLAFALMEKVLKIITKAAKLTLMDHVMGAVAGGLRAFGITLFIYGIVSIFSPVAKSEWMKESLVMRQVAVVWPVVFETITKNGWIDVSHLMPATQEPEQLPTPVSQDVAPEPQP